MTLTSYFPLSLPLILAAVLAYPSAPESPVTSPDAGRVDSPRLSAIVFQELDNEQRFRLISEMVRLRSDDRPVGLEVLRASLDHLDVETVLRGLAEESDRAAVAPIVQAGVSWIDQVVSLTPGQRVRLEQRLERAIARSGGAFANRIGQFGPGLFSQGFFDPEARAAFRELVQALLGGAADQQDEAQPLRRAVLEDLASYAASVRLVLTDGQEQAIRTAAQDFLAMSREDRQARVCELMAGVDAQALSEAIEAVRKAQPADRPKAVHAAADVLAAGLAPVWTTKFEISPLQQASLQAARESLFVNSQADRSTLSVMRDERRQSAWGSLDSEEQALLSAAAKSLRERIQNWRDSLCQ